MSENFVPDWKLANQQSTMMRPDTTASNASAFSPRLGEKTTATRFAGSRPRDTYTRPTRTINKPQSSTAAASISKKSASFLQEPHKQVMVKTLLTTAVGLGITAATAASAPPVLGLAPTLLSGLGYMAASALVHTLPPNQLYARLFSFAGGFVCLGLMVSGLTLLSSGLLTQAAILWAASVGVLSVAVALLPPGALERVYPMLLGVGSFLMVASIVALFLPASSVAIALQEVGVWVGLACGMGSFAHTLQRTCRPNLETRPHDALSLSMGMASAMVQMFTDIALVLSHRES